MATQQIDEYYESLAYWKQQALDYENQLRDIKCNTILNMAAEVEQLKKENTELKSEIDNLKIPSPYCPICNSCGEDGCCPAERCLYPTVKADTVTQHKELFKDACDEIHQLKSDLEIVRQTLEGQRAINDRQYAEKEQLKSKLKVAKESLEFYVVNGNECGIWDNELNGNDWGDRAKKALKEIGAK